MSLVDRVSLFFLAALAVCLGGYSLTCYLLIQHYLFAQFDRQLDSSFNTVVAAVEIEPSGVKWEPSDHTIRLGDDRDASEVRWVIADDRGRILDHSKNLGTTGEDAILLERAAGAPMESGAAAVESWRVLQKRLAPENPDRDEERGPLEVDAIIVTVARSMNELTASLWMLTLLVCVLPLAVWLLAAVVGRRLCRHALSPLQSMAQRALSTTKADFRFRLPVAAGRDELTDLALAFNGLLDQLQQAFDRQRRFTGDAAHQLRTPLTVLLGEIDVALRRPRTPAEQTQVFKTLREQTEELGQMVETLLFLARADIDGEQPEQRELELTDWVREYVAHWSDHPRAEDIRTSVPDGARVVASPSLLRQALDNLFGNAIKYSPPGSRVTLRVEQSETGVTFAVLDEGIGVPSDERQTIFQPFYRADQARRTGVEGAGLGLAIVARIAEALGGRVECHENLPRGSCFLLSLPGTRSKSLGQERLERRKEGVPLASA